MSANDVLNVVNETVKVAQEMCNIEGNVVPYNEEYPKLTWGNDIIELSKSDIAYLLLGGELFFFDGEYGHKIVLGKE